MSRSRLILVIILTLLFGWLLGWFSASLVFSFKEDKFFSQIKPIRVEDERYKFINPLISYELPESGDLAEFDDLKKEVNNFLTTTEKKSGVSISAYFKDLATGYWIGFNENRAYQPGSLFKVPLMMAYLRLARNQPDLLDKPLTFAEAEAKIKLTIPDSDFIKRNHSYTIKELIEALIVHSDNAAKSLLVAEIDKKVINDIFKDLNIEEPDINFGNDQVSVKEYPLFFRALYNATFLGKAISDYALGLLAKADFKDGLVAGVPENVVVAHKYGHYRAADDEGLIEELHDCGVVYYPGNHYLICIMTKGKNFEELKSVVKTASKIFYKFVNKKTAP